MFTFQSRGGEEEEEVEADGANYQLEMMRCLREVNVDNNTVGWYILIQPICDYVYIFGFCLFAWNVRINFDYQRLFQIIRVAMITNSKVFDVTFKHKQLIFFLQVSIYIHGILSDSRAYRDFFELSGVSLQYSMGCARHVCVHVYIDGFIEIFPCQH